MSPKFSFLLLWNVAKSIHITHFLEVFSTKTELNTTALKKTLPRSILLREDVYSKICKVLLLELVRCRWQLLGEAWGIQLHWVGTYKLYVRTVCTWPMKLWVPAETADLFRKSEKLLRSRSVELISSSAKEWRLAAVFSIICSFGIWSTCVKKTHCYPLFTPSCVRSQMRS